MDVHFPVSGLVGQLEMVKPGRASIVVQDHELECFDLGCGRGQDFEFRNGDLMRNVALVLRRCGTEQAGIEQSPFKNRLELGIDVVQQQQFVVVFDRLVRNDGNRTRKSLEAGLRVCHRCENR